ncbi:MAG: ABC transporter ATP-binding protein [Betaproteobacteria bacterium]|nr:ABC transporter ATP-binding protein [Betaproteobacteria bacterium]
MSSEPIIHAQGLGKSYALFARPVDRLKQALLGRELAPEQKFWALRDLDLDVHEGEVLGIVGRNGAGKSTLLQLLSGILRPSAGQLTVGGRVSALLELGSGFNPEFTGRENVFMNAAILGLSRAETEARLDGILAFADIGRFIDQPVKTYSSGMFVRLAFSIATSIDPDILIIDEALSVGDGAFARKSFDRIMQLREAGKTALICSHSLYHIEALCDRVLWLNQGRPEKLGRPTDVLPDYALSLEAAAAAEKAAATEPQAIAAMEGTARIVRVTLNTEGQAGRSVTLQSGETDLVIDVEFESDPALPPPGVGLGIDTLTGVVVATANSLNDGVVFARDARGRGTARITFARLPLLRGDYTVSVFLACERMLHIYDRSLKAHWFSVEQSWLEPGLVRLPHQWSGHEG